MKKLILLGLIIVMCLPLLASCITTLGADIDDNEPKTEQVVEEKVENKTEPIITKKEDATTDEVTGLKEYVLEGELKEIATELGIVFYDYGGNYVETTEEICGLNLIVLVDKEYIPKYLNRRKNPPKKPSKEEALQTVVVLDKAEYSLDDYMMVTVKPIKRSCIDYNAKYWIEYFDEVSGEWRATTDEPIYTYESCSVLGNADFYFKLSDKMENVGEKYRVVVEGITVNTYLLDTLYSETFTIK